MKAEQKQTGKTDTVLWVLVLILVVFGLGALFSASEYNGRVRFHDSAYYCVTVKINPLLCRGREDL